MNDLELKAVLSKFDFRGTPLDPAVIRLFLGELDCMIAAHTHVLGLLLKTRENAVLEIERRLKEVPK